MSDHAVDQMETWQCAGNGSEDFGRSLRTLFGWTGANGHNHDFDWRMKHGVLRAQDGRGEPQIQMVHVTAASGLMQFHIAPSLDIIAVLPVAGRIALTRDGHTTEAGDGQAVICQSLSPVTLTQAVDSGDCAAFMLSIAYGWMQRFLFELLQMPVEKDLQLGPLLDMATPRARLLEQFVGVLCSDVFVAQSRDLSPALQQQLMEAFSHVLLESVPHRYSARLAAPKAGPMPNYVRLARDYMHREARSNPSMADVARAAGISVRTLETSFRQYLDVTPHAYLRTVRLRMARQALSSRGNGSSIAGIATEFGFPHAGRFAQYYTELFGESPSDTRRKGPQKAEEGDGI